MNYFTIYESIFEPIDNGVRLDPARINDYRVFENYEGCAVW